MAISTCTSDILANLPASSSVPAVGAAGDGNGAEWMGHMGHLILQSARLLLGALYWLVTFATITLPTLLFALFSTSLTITMNFTTL